MSLFERLARWTHIAPFNLLLADIQRPGAPFVAFAEQWEWLQRRPLDDALPLILLWPFCPVRCAYTPDQTEGPDVSYDRLVHVFGGRLQRPENIARRLAKRVLKEDRIQVTFDKQPWREPEDKPKPGREPVEFVKVPWDKIELDLFRRLLPELLAHFLGHEGATNGNKWPDSRHKDGQVKKFEVAAAVWLVNQRFGLETGSVSGLLSQSGVADFREVSFAAIIKAAGRVETHIRLPDDSPLLRGRI